ncbi:MAG: hypothetical protein WC625_04780 [Caldisericia bacterium]
MRHDQSGAPMDGQVISTNNGNERKPKIGKWLLGMLLVWPVIILAVGVLGQIMIHGQFGECVAYIGSSILATTLVGIAVHHYPATRTFLKTLVAIILVVTLLGGGFYGCATLMRSGKLLKSIVDYWSAYSHAEPPLSTPNLVLNTFKFVTFSSSLPRILAETLYSLPIVSAYLLTYAGIATPYYLLLLFVTPPFLALPLFWLWVVLSVLYVVLPQRAWGWVKAAVIRFRHRP